MSFKERLRNEIEYRGLLIKEISSAVGISNSTFLSYIDARGVLPNIETAVKIADVLGVSVEYLVKGTNKQSHANQLRKDENELLENYRKLTKNNKAVVVAVISTLSQLKDK